MRLMHRSDAKEARSTQSPSNDAEAMARVSEQILVVDKGKKPPFE